MVFGFIAFTAPSSPSPPGAAVLRLGRVEKRGVRIHRVHSAVFGLALAAVLAAVGPDARAQTPALAAPTGVAAHAVDRRLTVSWNETVGATAYKVAARLANGLAPFPWREYTADAPPHTILDPRHRAMSGLQYEVRVASMNGDEQSPWSPVVTLTAPALRPAPADAIGTGSVPPNPPACTYSVGDEIRFALNHGPFENRSPWRWSICAADGSDCKLLPLPSRRTWLHQIGSAAQDKRLRVQVDYDKDGVSYTAAAWSGVIQARRPPPPPPPPPPLLTHLYALQSDRVALAWDAPFYGGAVTALGDDLLVVTTRGRIARVQQAPDRRPAYVEYLEGRVPMNLEQLQIAVNGSAQDPNELFRKRLLRPIAERFRVADVLLRKRSAGRYQLFVTHLYFTENCTRFRLSSTEVVLRDGSISLAQGWRTIFDAEPCLPWRLGLAPSRIGGRMLTDGPEHLLVVIGDHGAEDLPQAPDSHLGKLVRIEIETGGVEILASGLRNPQGLARDDDGVLWATDHGPQGGDELNVLRPGENYGWPLVTFGVGYDWIVRTTSVTDLKTLGQHHGGFAEPVFSWVPSIGISSILVNDEKSFPLWKDDLLIASLTGASLFRARRRGPGVQYVEKIEIGDRIRDMAKLPDGRIALLSETGIVYFLSRSYAPCGGDPEARRLRGQVPSRLSVYAFDCGCPLRSGFSEPGSFDRP